MRSIKPMRSIHFVLVAAVCPFVFLACAGCDSDPVRPVNNLPACWKPLVADTAFIPDPAPTQAQSSPVWSFSGLQVAYFSWFDSCNSRDPGIYIAGAEGGARRSKLPISGPIFKWLPGDTELIVNTGFFVGGELVIYNLNTDSVIPLGIQTRFPKFDVSDDGRYIYYEGEPAPQHMGSSIYEYDRNSGTQWAVVAGASPGISPNRSFLAYAAGPLFLYRFSDSNITELAPSGSAPDWTQDEKNIVYSDRFGKIFITDLQGNVRLITGQHNSLFGGTGPVSVSPNGLKILYQETSNDFFRHIWEINIDGSSARQFAQ